MKPIDQMAECRMAGCSNATRGSNKHCDPCLKEFVAQWERVFSMPASVMRAASRRLLSNREVRSGGLMEVHCSCGHAFLGGVRRVG